MPLAVVHRAAGNAVGLLDDRLMVFVRSAPLTEAAIAALELTTRRLAPSATSESPVGAIAVVPAEAGLSKRELLDRQRKLIASFKTTPHVYFAFVVLGDSAQGFAMRAVVRLFILGQHNMRMWSHTEPGAAWLGPQLGIDAADIREALRALQAVRTAG